MKKRVHVVAAVIRDGRGRLLIAKRPDHLHMGGLWEFPGGKLEPGETPQAALRRELLEELGIAPLELSSLLAIHHDYPDKAILLDVWRVDRFSGQEFGREGQEIRWVTAKDLQSLDFPAANAAIIQAICEW